MNIATTAETVSEMHDEHDVRSVAFQTLVISIGLTEAALWAAVWLGWIWLAVPLVLVAAHFMHGMLIGFHEASHGLLRKSRRLNEFDGVIIGMFSFLPFSLYRVVHQTHHIHLATERDTEFLARHDVVRLCSNLRSACFTRRSFFCALLSVAPP